MCFQWQWISWVINEKLRQGKFIIRLRPAANILLKRLIIKGQHANIKGQHANIKGKPIDAPGFPTIVRFRYRSFQLHADYIYKVSNGVEVTSQKLTDLLGKYIKWEAKY